MPNTESAAWAKPEVNLAARKALFNGPTVGAGASTAQSVWRARGRKITQKCLGHGPVELSGWRNPKGGNPRI